MKNSNTAKNVAMLLISHQQGTIKVPKNLLREEIIQNAHALVHITKETRIPLVLSSSKETEFQALPMKLHCEGTKIRSHADLHNQIMAGLAFRGRMISDARFRPTCTKKCFQS
jgi:hypothetical protein